MTFIGYQQGAKAYLFMNKDNKVVINPHATFDETTFPRMTVKECPHPNTNKDQSTNQNTWFTHGNKDPSYQKGRDSTLLPSESDSEDNKKKTK